MVTNSRCKRERERERENTLSNVAIDLRSQYGRKRLRYHALRWFHTITTQLVSAINLWQVRSDVSTGASATQG